MPPSQPVQSPDETPIFSDDQLRRRGIAMRQNLEYAAGVQDLQQRDAHHREDIADRQQRRDRRQGLILVEKVRLWIGTGHRLVLLAVAVVAAVVAVAAGLRPSDLLDLFHL